MVESLIESLSVCSRGSPVAEESFDSQRLSLAVLTLLRYRAAA
jgi:hypothetical protein